MDNYFDDYEQSEALKRWWREYGRSVLIGLVLGLIVLFGTRAWFQHRSEQAHAASLIYAGLMEGLQSGADAQVLGDAGKLRKDFASTPYAALAALAQAGVKVKSGDLKAAAADLHWVLKNAGDAGVQHIARLRLARVLVAQGQPAQALTLMAQAKPGTFAASYAEVKGDALLAEGKTQQAREAYRKAIAALAPGARLRPLLQMKLDELASTAATKTPGDAGTPASKAAKDSHDKAQSQ